MRHNSAINIHRDSATEVRTNNRFVYLETSISEEVDLTPEIKRRVRLARFRFRNFSWVRCNKSVASLDIKVRMLNAEVHEVLLYGFVTWSVKKDRYKDPGTAHLRFLRR